MSQHDLVHFTESLLFYLCDTVGPQGLLPGTVNMAKQARLTSAVDERG